MQFRQTYAFCMLLIIQSFPTPPIACIKFKLVTSITLKCMNCLPSFCLFFIRLRNCLNVSMILKALIVPMHEVVAAQKLPGAIHCLLFLQVVRIAVMSSLRILVCSVLVLAFLHLFCYDLAESGLKFFGRRNVFDCEKM